MKTDNETWAYIYNLEDRIKKLENRIAKLEQAKPKVSAYDLGKVGTLKKKIKQ